MLDQQKMIKRLEILRHEPVAGSVAERYQEADKLVAAFVDSLGHPDLAIQFLLTREWRELPDERRRIAKCIAETQRLYAKGANGTTEEIPQ